MKVLILGVNGFIGSHLSEKILTETDWDIYGLDISSEKIGNVIDNPRFHFLEGDIDINKEWIEYHIKKCDVVLPLVAIATPLTYVQDPLRVFELDFEANLAIIKQAVKYRTRVIFPSTSEVYGMCTDDEFNEETSNFILGPTNKQRWIYSCCKQLLDRVLWAHGQKSGFKFSIFRPYNWLGPRLDDIESTKEGSSRVITQFIGDVIHGKPIRLVNGGLQKRCFLYIDDGIDCLLKIIENKDGACDSKIFNIGNPDNNMSIAELADEVKAIFEAHPLAKEHGFSDNIKIEKVTEEEFYGKGYQDVSFRVPSIKNAKETLGWTPKHDFKSAMKLTVDWFIQDYVKKNPGKTKQAA